MPWGDDRGSAWKKTRLRILKRDNYRCYICKQPGANQVDHINPIARGGTEDDSNLAAIHGIPCHRTKTLREAAQGQALKSSNRPPAQHPGLR